MKRFVFTRLHARDMDYDYYIPPAFDVNLLGKNIASDHLEAGKKFILLQRMGTVITFGVRERLELRDMRGRLITHFTGYQIEQGEDQNPIPSFAALERNFQKITNDALQCHSALNQDSKCGKTLQVTDVSFMNIPSDTAWDRAVGRVLTEPGANFLFMFDEHGNECDLPYPLPKPEVAEVDFTVVLTRPDPETPSQVFDRVAAPETPEGESWFDAWRKRFLEWRSRGKEQSACADRKCPYEPWP